MSITTSLIAIGVFLAFAVFCGWRGARMPNPTRGPRLIPWRLMMVLSAAMCTLILLHMLVTLKGG